MLFFILGEPLRVKYELMDDASRLVLGHMLSYSLAGCSCKICRTRHKLNAADMPNRAWHAERRFAHMLTRLSFARISPSPHKREQCCQVLEQLVLLARPRLLALICLVDPSTHCRSRCVHIGVSACGRGTPPDPVSLALCRAPPVSFSRRPSNR